MKTWFRNASKLVQGAFLGSLVATALFFPMVLLATTWTTPTTFSAGQTLTAALMNTYVRDNTNFLKEQVDVQVNVTQAGNIGTGEDDLITYTLPAATLSANGMCLRITDLGSLSANGVLKTIKHKFGSTSTTLYSASDVNAHWKNVVEVCRTGAATQIGTIAFTISNATSTFSISPTETLAGTVVIKLTAESTNDNDVVQKAKFVERLTPP